MLRRVSELEKKIFYFERMAENCISNAFDSLKCQTLSFYIKMILKLIPYETLELYFQLYCKFQANTSPNPLPNVPKCRTAHIL